MPIFFFTNLQHFELSQFSSNPYLKSPYHTCGTPHNICGTPQVHVEFLRNQCGINALRNSAKVSQHAVLVPHPTSEYFPHQYGKFSENSDLVFLHSGNMRKVLT